jgi:hypothetical protein
MFRPLLPALVSCAICVACAGASPAPSSAPPSVQPTSEPAGPAVSAHAPVAAAPAAAVTDEAYEDPDEHDPATLAPLFGKRNRPPLPKATTGERECWQTVPLTGVARTDFDALIAHCGTPTGLVEYAKPSAGKLHHRKDRRDTYVVRIQGGLCYRFFGVADATIENLDIVIERTNGALVGEDRTRGPVAIIDTDKVWCMDRDEDYRFNVQVGGEGTGNYVFGVWARPDKCRRVRPLSWRTPAAATDCTW